MTPPNTTRGLVELKVQNGIFSGWESMEIKTGIEQIAGSFSLAVTERWAGQATPIPIMAGFPCSVLLDGMPVISGFVDETSVNYDSANHAVNVTGRDKTGDLVDCSAIHKSGQWHQRTLTQIAVDICQPFGIKVSALVDVGEPFKSFNIQEGERAFEALDRLARMRAVLLVSDGLGNLIITRAGQTSIATELVEGQNILRANAHFDWKDRFSSYIAKGQHRGQDDAPAASAASPSGSYTDTVVSRYRPLVLLAEDQGHISSLKERAEWEAQVRMGRSARATVTVQGWSHAEGLWKPNTIVHLRSPMLYADLDLLIVQCTYKLDNSGTTTELELCRPEAFDLIAGVKTSRLGRELSNKKRNGAAVRVQSDKRAWQKANAGAGYVSAIDSINQGEGWK